ncbi:MAG: hypothetical protein MUC51_07305 [Anaerolineae bacterium]|nr:hypothetical protein [Anaerolineae bacterium]
MRRTTIVFFVIVGLSVAIALFALYGPTRSRPVTGWKGMFLRQGLRPSSTQEPFEDYLVKGMGHSPIVIIYEAQYVAQAACEDGSVLPDMVPMYPTPTIFAKHILIPFSANGEKLGQALEARPA